MILCISLLSVAYADDYVIYVARKDSKALEVAKTKSDNKSIYAERTFHKALVKAADLLQLGKHTVTVMVANGEYVGKAKQGVWIVPKIDNPEATLRLIGGFNDDFSERKPFDLLTALVTNEGRNGAFIQFTKKSKLHELVISGFLFDAAASNKYDDETNSILKGQSRTYPLISLSLVMLDHLVIDSNIFINGAHGAFDPYVTPTSNTMVDITNNFFLNTIKAIQIGAGLSFRGNTVKEINLRNNSFILCWPFNPDATSSEVSAIKLYHKEGAEVLNIENNLFAFNPGGVMQHDWPEDRMPDINLRNNLFYMNAGLFGDGEVDAGVLAGKFGTNPKYLILNLETVEEDFSYTVEGNVAIDPKVPVALVDLTASDSYSVHRKSTVLNDLRNLFGLNQRGGTVSISGFAPAMTFDVNNLPIPMEQNAKTYGVQINELWNP
jgi:hypothetical protein